MTRIIGVCLCPKDHSLVRITLRDRVSLEMTSMPIMQPRFLTVQRNIEKVNVDNRQTGKQTNREDKTCFVI